MIVTWINATVSSFGVAVVAIVPPNVAAHIGQIPGIDPRTLRGAACRFTIDRRMERSALATSDTLLERKREVERVRTAVRAVGKQAGVALVIEGA